MEGKANGSCCCFGGKTRVLSLFFCPLSREHDVSLLCRRVSARGFVKLESLM